ncbi:MAG: hypothetical protein Q9165_002156 [Trypethelium subeluteriae]
MAPSAITPERSTTPETVTDLTNAGIKATITKTAPSISTTTKPQPTHLAELDASLLHTTLTSTPRTVPTAASLSAAGSQKKCTDHMITCTWSCTTGWQTPELVPFGPLSLMPNASCLHYATTCFEGLKLHRGVDGRLRLFRPQLNCARMLRSAARIALPGFAPAQLLRLIVALCAADAGKWLPRRRRRGGVDAGEEDEEREVEEEGDEEDGAAGRFLYVRPAMVASDASLGVGKPNEALLFVLLSCFPDLSKSGVTGRPGLRLLASQEDMVRAWPGGFGHAKVGANYGPTFVAQGEARERGYDQILWLFGENGVVTEAGASNFFVVWKTRDGRTQLVTAPLEEKIILDGVTRRSVVELARERWPNECEVVERTFEMREVAEAVQEGRILEAFTAGTAVFIAPVAEIHFKGADLHIPMGKGEGGPFTLQIRTWLEDVMCGRTEHPWSLVIEEDDA